MPLKPFNMASPQAERTADRTAKGVKPAILYVEDEDPNWDVASVSLAGRYDMFRARNSDEAFAELASREHRVILMDIQLSKSEFSGIEIARILTNKFAGPLPELAKKHVGKAPPIIFVTAYSARYASNDLAKYGGDDLITKPIDFLKLTSAITRCLVRSIRNST